MLLRLEIEADQWGEQELQARNLTVTRKDNLNSRGKNCENKCRCESCSNPAAQNGVDAVFSLRMDMSLSQSSLREGMVASFSWQACKLSQNRTGQPRNRTRSSSSLLLWQQKPIMTTGILFVRWLGNCEAWLVLASQSFNLCRWKQCQEIWINSHPFLF